LETTSHCGVATYVSQCASARGWTKVSAIGVQVGERSILAHHHIVFHSSSSSIECFILRHHPQCASF